MSADMGHIIATVLVEHQRHRGGCLCGWAVLGGSHPAHQAGAVIAALGGTYKRVEWGVKYVGDAWHVPGGARETPYESEAEARRQLNFAQMDVLAVLVNRIGDGPWTEVPQ